MTSDSFDNVELSEGVNDTLKDLGIINEKSNSVKMYVQGSSVLLLTFLVFVLLSLWLDPLVPVHLEQNLGWVMLAALGAGAILGVLRFFVVKKRERERILSKSPTWRRTTIEEKLLDQTCAKTDWLKDESEFSQQLRRAKKEAYKLKGRRDTINNAYHDAENSKEEWQDERARIESRIVAIKGTIASLEGELKEAEQLQSACEEVIPDLAENYERQALVVNKDLNKELRSRAEDCAEVFLSRLEELTRTVKQANKKARNTEI
jgi:uncharacterized protein YukE